MYKKFLFQLIIFPQTKTAIKQPRKTKRMKEKKKQKEIRTTS